MFIAIATISMFTITGLIWLLNRILPFKICPICAGVSGTWLWMLAAKFLGYEIEMAIPAMLMGGSIVGVVYQIEKRLPPSRSLLLWKTLSIPAGFAAVYSVISSWWTAFIVTTILLIIWTFRFLRGPRHPATPNGKAVKELEDKMRNCC